jgi:hypothetical protein
MFILDLVANLIVENGQDEINRLFRTIIIKKIKKLIYLYFLVVDSLVSTTKMLFLLLNRSF